MSVLSLVLIAKLQGGHTHLFFKYFSKITLVSISDRFTDIANAEICDT
jgi:hypothetical protein